MNIVFIGFVIITCFIIAILTLKQNSKSPINRSFALLNVLVMLITVFYHLSDISYKNPQNSILANQVLFVIVFWFPVVLYVFCLHYPIKKNKINKILFSYTLLSTLIISILSVSSNLLIENVLAIEDRIEITRGPLYTIGVINAIIIFIAALMTLQSKYKTLNNIEKVKIKYLVLSFLVLIGLTIPIAIVSPLITGTTEISRYTSIVFIPWLLIISFTILRHRLFDIRFIVGKFTYYLILSLIPYTIFYFIGGVYLNFIGDIFNPATFLIGLPIAFGFVFIFNTANDFIKRQVTTRFINPGYDPYEIVDSLGKDLATTLEIQEVADSVIQILKRTVRAEFNGIVILERKENARFRYLKYGEEFKNRNITPANYKKILFIWQQIGREPLIFDELNYLTKTKLKDLKHWIDPIYKQMKQDQVRAIFPIGTTEEVHGLLMLGQKEADSPYTSQDTELLNSISSTAGLALARSLFYQETKEFAQTLQGRVDRATSSLSEQNKALEMALERIEKIRQREQDMLDVMGHELRTPITIVRNILSMMKMYIDKKQKIPQPKLEDYVKRSLESVKREMILIETLLAATKIDANRVQLNLEKVNLYEVVRDAIEGQKHLAKQRKLTLEFDKPGHTKRYGEEVFVYADRVRIQEIIDNFTSNAVKYTIEGGVTISFEKIENQTGQPMMKINVKDTGIGIPEEDVKKLGRKFFRARQYIKEEQKDNKVVRPGGTGLGLYVSFELIKLMGGEFFIQSKVGEGSTFSFTIPFYTGQKPKHIDQTFDTDDELYQMLEKQKKKNTTPAEEELDETEQVEAKLRQTKESIENIYIPENEKEDPKEIKQENGYKRISNANEIISQINEGKEFLEKDKSDENIKIAPANAENK